jgi:hypothetical protein
MAAGDQGPDWALQNSQSNKTCASLLQPMLFLPSKMTGSWEQTMSCIIQTLHASYQQHTRIRTGTECTY